MTTFEERQQRVANGSRRKRDVEAVQGARSFEQYAKSNFPDEDYWAVQAAAFHVKKSLGHPEPKAVREYMAAKGWLLEQRS